MLRDSFKNSRTEGKKLVRTLAGHKIKGVQWDLINLSKRKVLWKSKRR